MNTGRQQTTRSPLACSPPLLRTLLPTPTTVFDLSVGSLHARTLVSASPHTPTSWEDTSVSTTPPLRRAVSSRPLGAFTTACAALPLNTSTSLPLRYTCSLNGASLVDYHLAAYLLNAARPPLHFPLPLILGRCSRPLPQRRCYNNLHTLSQEDRALALVNAGAIEGLRPMGQCSMQGLQYVAMCVAHYHCHLSPYVHVYACYPRIILLPAPYPPLPRALDFEDAESVPVCADDENLKWLTAHIQISDTCFLILVLPPSTLVVSILVQDYYHK
ncbi:hypothetical protein R3P38DRAFT_3227349 [Favolaschia claudopus]|uniref:Uncharacterized protein n=1 Tax=Favolaschia claudopus TaxID=2862362 RepID=A0AAV9ZSI7_9AGAR